MKTSRGTPATTAGFFRGRPESRRLYNVLMRELEALGPSSLRVTRSQIAFLRKTTFARVWIPGQYLGRGAPLVLTLGFRRRDPSPRWKSVVEPAPGRFTHHLEIFDPADIDGEVRAWLKKAWEAAG